MNRFLGQSGSLDPLRPIDGALGSTQRGAGSFSMGITGEQALLRVELRRSLQLHRRLALWIAIAGTALALAYFLLFWPVYLAQSLIYLQPAAPRVMDQGGAMRWPYDSGTYESFMQQQILSVTRDDVLANALRKLGPGVWQGSDRNEQAAIERLRGTLEVARVGNTYQFTVGARSSNPEIAAQIANAVTASYIESATREQKSGNPKRIEMIREERDRIQNELATDRAEQAALNKQMGVAGIGNATPDHYDEDITRTRSELVTARTLHDVAAAKFTAMGAGLGPSSGAIDAEAEGLIAGDAGLASMKTSLNQRRAVLITQMANLMPSHPLYKQDAAELAQIDATLESAIKDLRAKAASQIQERLRTDLEQAAGVEARMNGRLRQLVGVAGSATPKMQRSSDLAADITRLQARFTTVDELLHNLLLEDGAPGAVYLSTAAKAALHPAKSGVIRNAVLLVFASIIFGMMMAVGAHKLDPRIYVASDVEQVLGFAPMCQLPDFTEVSDGVAEEHMLRLSTTIEYARKQGNLKSCIFTGTGPGTGVTTVVTKVREMLEAMGRPSVLVDASGTARPAARAESVENGLGDDASGRGSRSAALLKQMARETESQEGSLVLTDAAPLVVSAETQYLARYVDCVIVVVESGVTTRAQLRDVASTLQRLDVAAVGFVLNRVGLEKSDPVFRHSVLAVERHLHAQSRSSAGRSVGSHPFAAEAKPSTGPSADEAAFRAKIGQVTSAPVSSVTDSQTNKVLERPTVAMETGSLPHRVFSMPPAKEPVEHTVRPDSELPWWLEDVYKQPVTPASPLPSRSMRLREPEAVGAVEPFASTRRFEQKSHSLEFLEYASGRIYESKTDRSRGAEAAQDDAGQQDLEAAPDNAASRLKGLRNLLFSLGLKALNENQTSESLDNETMRQPEKGAGPPIYAHTFVPEPEPVPVIPSRGDATRASQRQVTAQPEFLPPKPPIEAEGKENLWATSSTGRRDRRDSYDGVEILPSWRGQYKKKS